MNEHNIDYEALEKLKSDKINEKLLELLTSNISIIALDLLH
jgi:hypothetical protein